MVKLVVGLYYGCLGSEFQNEMNVSMLLIKGGISLSAL